MEPIGQNHKIVSLSKYQKRHSRTGQKPVVVEPNENTFQVEDLSIESSPFRDLSEDSTSFILYHCSPDHHDVIFVSQQAAESIGYDSSVLTLDDWLHQIHPEDSAQVNQDLVTLPQAGVLNHCYRFLTARGHYQQICGRLHLARPQVKIQERTEHWFGVFVLADESFNRSDQSPRSILLSVTEVIKDLQCETIHFLEHLQQALQRLGPVFNVDRLGVVKILHSDTDELMMQLVSEWGSPVTSSGNLMAAWPQHPISTLGLWSWIAELEQDQAVLGAISELPDSTLYWIQSAGVRQYLLVPIQLGGCLWGFIGLFDSQLERHWSETEQAGLKAISVSISGVLKRQQMEADLDFMASHDALTHLPNRRYFLKQLEQVLAQADTQDNAGFAVLFLDLDRFKDINDSLGHAIGDQVLIATAERLQACLHPHDVVARLGGDEFTILLNSVEGAGDATDMAIRIQEQLSQPLELDDHTVTIGASIGITLSSTGYQRPEDFLRAADTAMYRAKHHGGARYQIYDATLQVQVKNYLQMEADLRNALEAQELRVYYQPIISLLTGKIAGFEALARWMHPQHGLLMPGQFISIAEETGLIIPIDLAVLRIACQQVEAWNCRLNLTSPLKISTNLSSLHFKSLGLIDAVKAILLESKLNPQFLQLEITETSIIENADLAADIISMLRTASIGVCLDDFGTGYSSLDNLRRFPISTLKVDRSFVQAMGSDPETFEIVRTMMILAHNLGMDVIAEGVETQGHLNQLLQLQCEFVQGYFFSKPVNQIEAEELIKPEFIFI